MRELRRIGKRIAISVDNDLWLVLHLMIAGRLHWRKPEANSEAARCWRRLIFRRALCPHRGRRSSDAHRYMSSAARRDLLSVDPGGIDVFSADLESFRATLTVENRTLKRALTDPRLLSGIGNAYSDEILHAAQLSPISLTHKLKPDEWVRRYTQPPTHLELWMDRLKAEAKARISRKSHRISEGNGGAWALRGGVSALRRKGSAHPLC